MTLLCLETPPRFYLCRRLSSIDRDAVAGHLKELSPQDRLSRFQACQSDAALDTYCRAIDWARCVSYGAFAADEMIGLAEIFLLGGDEYRSCEVAVTVAALHRRRGIATHLVGLALDGLAGSGLACARFEFCPGNMGIQRMIRSLGGSIDTVYGTGNITLPMRNSRSQRPAEPLLLHPGEIAATGAMLCLA
jgi:GNAT superfamily N-acetyltransferase